MPFKDYREFLAVLEQKGELRRVKEEVDWRYELGAWTRHAYDMKPRGPALLFENLKDYGPERPVFTNGLGTYRRMAIALGFASETSVRELIQVFKERVSKPIPPKIVAKGPVQENIVKGEEVDFFHLPVPWWTPRDAGRFLTWHVNVSKNPETNVNNLGLYRMQIFGRRLAGIGFTPHSHMNLHYIQRQLRDEPLEIAVAIGVDETVAMAAIAGVPESVDEYSLAGGLRGEAVELVKCQTVDLHVPATAEIVLEGKILPHLRKPEGPFGEHTGYHGGGVRMRPIFEATAITFRNNPILRGTLRGKPIDEGHVVDSIMLSAMGLASFEKAGPSGVKAVYCPPDGAPGLGAVIQIKPYYVGHSRDVGRFWLSTRGGRKYVIVVDEDIDPFNLSEVWWAITTRTRASRDFEVLPFGRISRSDPSASREGEFTDYLIIDATKKLDYPYIKAYGGHWAPVCMPPAKLMDLVALKWRKSVDGELIEQPAIDGLAREISQMEKGWDAWRNEAYTLSQEEQEREISRSYPKIAKD